MRLKAKDIMQGEQNLLALMCKSKGRHSTQEITQENTPKNRTVEKSSQKGSQKKSVEANDLMNQMQSVEV